MTEKDANDMKEGREMPMGVIEGMKRPKPTRSKDHIEESVENNAKVLIANRENYEFTTNDFRSFHICFPVLRLQVRGVSLKGPFVGFSSFISLTLCHY